MYEYDDYDYVEWLGMGTCYVLSDRSESPIRKRHFWSRKPKAPEIVFEIKPPTFGFGRVLDE